MTLKFVCDKCRIEINEPDNILEDVRTIDDKTVCFNCYKKYDDLRQEARDKEWKKYRKLLDDLLKRTGYEKERDELSDTHNKLESEAVNKVFLDFFKKSDKK